MAASTSLVYAGTRAVQDHAALLVQLGLLGLLVTAVLQLIYRPLWGSPLARVPGPTLFALSKWRLALEDYRGTRTPCIRALHERYGPVVRIAPTQVSFASLSALRTIYSAGGGAGASFERTAFYRMFDVYGRQNLFTFGPAKLHADRKRLVAHAYSKSAVLRPDGLASPLIARNVRGFLALLDAGPPAQEQEIFHSLHWFSLDSITGFLYGDTYGGTRALARPGSLSDGNDDRRLLDDILDPARRKLTWFAIHLRAYTAWLYGPHAPWVERLVARLGLLPMQRPSTYTGIRAHALQSWQSYEKACTAQGQEAQETNKAAASIMDRLQQHRVASKADSKNGRGASLDGLDIASELADHFLAGIDTTSDTAMFAIWALSRPEHARYQARLRAELAALTSPDGLDEHGNPTADAADRLPFLDAVVRETLRLYAPLPASEPRVCPAGDVVVDGVRIPAGTVVSMDPYTLHRNAAVFPEPLAFRPERWLGEDRALGDVAEMRRWFWAFSSGGRMCIGMHLAMAEITMLLSALYRRYATALPPRQQGMCPGITSRFEVFGDSTFSKVSEHECWIAFEKIQPEDVSNHDTTT